MSTCLWKTCTGGGSILSNTPFGQIIVWQDNAGGLRLNFGYWIENRLLLATDWESAKVEAVKVVKEKLTEALDEFGA